MGRVVNFVSSDGGLEGVGVDEQQVEPLKLLLPARIGRRCSWQVEQMFYTGRRGRLAGRRHYRTGARLVRPRRVASARCRLPAAGDAPLDRGRGRPPWPGPRGTPELGSLSRRRLVRPAGTACWGAWSSTTVLAPAASPSSSCSYPLLHSHPATTRRRPREITALDREPIGSLRRLRLRPAPGRAAPVLSTVLLAVVLAGAAPGTRAIRAIRQRAR